MLKNLKAKRLFLALGSLVLLVTLGGLPAHTVGNPDVQAGGGAGDRRSTSPNLKVAFIGDQSLSFSAGLVLRLIRREGADMVLHLGDFDYNDDPESWDQMINDILGPSVPYFALIGNHDVTKWSDYQQRLQARLSRINGATCNGDLGIKSVCRYQGLFFILSGVGLKGLAHEHVAYMEEQLAQDNSIWRICSWHLNQTAMQLGDKNNATGWGPYEACRKGGAIIATAHNHIYARTKTLISMLNQTVDPAWSEPDKLRVASGASFVFISGLGGQGTKPQVRCLPGTYPYGCKREWAKIYTSVQGAVYGALFITFNVDGNPRKARGEFINMIGQTIDTFEVTSQVGSKARSQLPEGPGVTP